MSHRLALTLLAALVLLANSLDCQIAAELAGETKDPAPIAAMQIVGGPDGQR